MQTICDRRNEAIEKFLSHSIELSCTNQLLIGFDTLGTLSLWDKFSGKFITTITSDFLTKSNFQQVFFKQITLLKIFKNFFIIKNAI